MSMNNTLLIPSTILVGFQSRTDTFTGKLAYVIYKDHKGKIRKEASWNGWRSKDIETLELPNDPQQGFTFNKGVKRDGYWGNGRSVIRVWDPRDFEFEISIDNLVGVLMHSDVSKRDIVEKCVFAWNGTELVLLPVNSVEFTESTKHTEKQSQKISARDLKVGATYTIKKENKQVVYLGRFDRFKIETVYINKRYGGDASDDHIQKKGKSHVFTMLNATTYEQKFHVRDPGDFLAYMDSDEMHPDYASLMDEYYKSAETQPVIGIAVADRDLSRYSSAWWKKIGENEFVELKKDSDHQYDSNTRETTYRYFFKVERFARFNSETNRIEYSHNGTDRKRYGYYSQEQEITPRFLPGMHHARTDVVKLVDDMTTEYQTRRTIIEQQYKEHHEWQVRNKAEVELEAELKKKYSCGSLHFVMKNGKLSSETY